MQCVILLMIQERGKKSELSNCVCFWTHHL